MITIEITKGPRECLGQFRFEKNELYLGRDPLDLAIADEKLQTTHILLEIPENDLLVHPQKGVEFYLLNGKRSTSIRKVKAGDTIGIGNTELKIVSFDKVHVANKKEVLDAKLAKLIENNSPRLAVIEKLSKSMK